MSNRSKGARHELIVAKYLQSQGYLVERGFRRVAFLNGRPMPIVKDLFGAFDIVAILPPNTVRFVQVTCGNVSSRRSKVFEVWSEGEIWEHMKGSVYRVHQIFGSHILDVRQLDRS